MARPAFAVQHLIFCTSVGYADVRRPHRNSTLDGVDFVFAHPPNAELPIEPDEFWLYARLYSRSDQPGVTPPLSVTCLWLDAPDGAEVEVWTHALGAVPLRKPRGVIDRGWAFRNTEDAKPFRFPRLGRYVFRLWHPARTWPRVRVKAEEFISVEVQP